MGRGTEALWHFRTATGPGVERPGSPFPSAMTSCLWPTSLCQGPLSWGALGAHPGQHAPLAGEEPETPGRRWWNSLHVPSPSSFSSSGLSLFPDRVPLRLGDALDSLPFETSALFPVLDDWLIQYFIIPIADYTGNRNREAGELRIRGNVQAVMWKEKKGFNRACSHLCEKNVST